MQIVIQAHHAEISEPMRERARRAVERVAERISRTVNAIVRFEGDGPMRRVEIVLHCPRQRTMVAEGKARAAEAALAAAITRLRRQAAAAKHTRKSAKGDGRLAARVPVVPAEERTAPGGLARA